MSEPGAVEPAVVFARNPACFVREEEAEGGFLFNADTGKVSLMNPTAVGIWNLLDGERTVGDLVVALRGVFSDTPPDLEQQVWGHLQALREMGVVGTVGAKAGDADEDASIS